MALARSEKEGTTEVLTLEQEKEICKAIRDITNYWIGLQESDNYYDNAMQFSFADMQNRLTVFLLSQMLNKLVNNLKEKYGIVDVIPEDLRLILPNKIYLHVEIDLNQKPSRMIMLFKGQLKKQIDIDLLKELEVANIVKKYPEQYEFLKKSDQLDKDIVSLCHNLENAKDKDSQNELLKSFEEKYQKYLSFKNSESDNKGLGIFSLRDEHGIINIEKQYTIKKNAIAEVKKDIAPKKDIVPKTATIGFWSRRSTKAVLSLAAVGAGVAAVAYYMKKR